MREERFEVARPMQDADDYHHTRIFDVLIENQMFWESGNSDTAQGLNCCSLEVGQSTAFRQDAQ